MYVHMTNLDENIRVITPMPKSLVDRINDFRFEHRCDSKSEAVRKLIELGLSAAEKQKHKEKA